GAGDIQVRLCFRAITVDLCACHRDASEYQATGHILVSRSLLRSVRYRRQCGGCRDVAADFWARWRGQCGCQPAWTGIGQLVREPGYRNLDADLARRLAVWVAHADLPRRTAPDTAGNVRVSFD